MQKLSIRLHNAKKKIWDNSDDAKRRQLQRENLLKRILISAQVLIGKLIWSSRTPPHTPPRPSTLEQGHYTPQGNLKGIRKHKTKPVSFPLGVWLIRYFSSPFVFTCSLPISSSRGKQLFYLFSNQRSRGYRCLGRSFEFLKDPKFKKF